MDRTGKARWEGDLKQGKGTFAVGSGSFGGAYSFNTRFGDTPGTNPEELIGAAHAACFSMAFSAGLAKAAQSFDVVTTHSQVVLADGNPSGPSCTIEH